MGFTGHFMLKVEVGGKVKQYERVGPMKIKHVVGGGGCARI